jgi:hypothetical protein
MQNIRQDYKILHRKTAEHLKKNIGQEHGRGKSGSATL